MTSRARRTRPSSVLLAVACTAVLAACHKGAPVAPLVPASMSPTQGSDAQSGTVGQRLPASVVVRVYDQNGSPMGNVVVVWTIVAGGGSLDTGLSTTDAQGDALVNWTLGTVAGVDSLEAYAGGAVSYIVVAKGQPGPVTTLSKVAGDQQAVAKGTTSAPLIVQARDQYGNLVPGSAITWVDQNGGALSAAQTTTDASGDASVTLTTDPSAETYTIVAQDGAARVTFVVTSS